MIEINKLELASKAYYAGNPIMTDAEFDTIIIELRKNDPDNTFLKRIGSPIPGTCKVKHEIPMGSLSNANNEMEFRAWIPDWKPDICLSHKLDGSSVELVYNEGNLVRAITRGDGEVGEDVTRNVLLSPYAPLKIDPSITSVRCECLIHKKDWEEHFKGDANPRNSAAGTLRRHDGHNAKYLRFYAFDALVDDSNANRGIALSMLTEFDVLLSLSCWFAVPHTAWSSNPDNMVLWYKKEEAERDKLAYEIDGIVAKIDYRKKSQEMGSRDGRPKGQIAIKFKPRGGETVLRKVVWQVGHTGVLTPVGEVDPVWVGGTIIKRVSLCNMDEIIRLQIAIGDMVEIVRAGDVIPKVIKRIRTSDQESIIYSPIYCPECGCKTRKDGARILCPNEQCSGRSFSRVMTWIKKRNILNMGPGLIIAAKIKSIQQLYEMSFEEWINVEMSNGKLGIKRASKVMESLEKSKSVTLSDFLGSIGIKGVGRSLASDLCKNFSGLPESQLTLEDIFGLWEELIAGYEGFGAVRAADFCSWLKQHRNEVMCLADILDIEYESNNDGGFFEGETICFTGKSPKPRSEMGRLAEVAGASVVNSISNKTTILVIADVSSTSSKVVKARELGIKLISPQDFLLKIGI